MKKFKFLAAVLAFTAVLVSSCKEVAPEIPESPYPGFQKVVSSIQSKVLGTTVEYTLLVPKTYDPNTVKRYPVIYVLHNDGDNQDSWLTNVPHFALELSNAIVLQAMPEVIIAMPNGFDSYYLDKDEYKTVMRSDGGMNYETFFFDEFIHEVEMTYNCGGLQGARALVGNGMGGYGALHLGLRHPEGFSNIFAMSPVESANLFELAKKADPNQLPVISIGVGDQDATNQLSVNLLNKISTLRENTDEDQYLYFFQLHGKANWGLWADYLPVAFGQIGESFLKTFPKFSL